MLLRRFAPQQLLCESSDSPAGFVMTMRPKWIAVAAAVVLGLVAATFVFHRECAFGGGMPGWYRACTCKGIERLDYDQTAADGHRRTTCIGLVTASTCYLYQGGPTVPCDSIPALQDGGSR